MPPPDFQPPRCHHCGLLVGFTELVEMQAQPYHARCVDAVVAKAPPTGRIYEYKKGSPGPLTR